MRALLDNSIITINSIGQVKAINDDSQFRDTTLISKSIYYLRI